MHSDRTLDIETKLRLLISLVNDEGRDKLNSNIEKLIIRMSEYADTHGKTICEYFTQAYDFNIINRIIHVPCKASIYAYILARFYEKTGSQIVRDIVNSVYSYIGEEKEGKV
jgi:hypothetical protein